MENSIEELKGTIDQVLIDNALNIAHLKTLEYAFMELAQHVLGKESESMKVLNHHFYHTLYENSASLLNKPSFLYHDAKAQFALLELKSYVNRRLKLKD